jgi:cardiolipin synthase
MVFLVLNGLFVAAFWLFVAAGVSDAVDGYLAKILGQVTTLGGYLDPTADKVLLVAVFLTLGHAGYLPDWLIILVVSRDLLIVGGVIFVNILTGNVNMRPLMVSKLNTVVQILLVSVILGELAMGLNVPDFVRSGLVYLVAATTILSGGAYLVEWGRNADDRQEAG